MLDKKIIEQRLLMQSAGLMGLLAVAGTIMGIVSGSSAILLDGVTAFIGVIIKLMMIGTSSLVTGSLSLWSSSWKGLLPFSSSSMR